MPTFHSENECCRQHWQQSEDVGKKFHDYEKMYHRELDFPTRHESYHRPDPRELDFPIQHELYHRPDPRELDFPTRHELYHRPDQSELDFPDGHGSYHRNLLVPDQTDYDAWNQHQIDVDIYQQQIAHEKYKMLRRYKVNGGEIDPVSATIATAIGVGIVVKAVETHVIPALTEQYKTHITPQVDKALKTFDKKSEPTAPQKKTGPAPPKPAAAQNPAALPKPDGKTAESLKGPKKAGCSLM